MDAVAPTSSPPPLPNEAPIIAGFWRRVLGCFIDGIPLGLVGCILGIFFFDYLARLGGWGRLVGFVVAFLYFVPLNSRIGNGRTIGKRLVGTCVVGRDGQTIGIGRSAIRFLILSTPFFLNGAAIPQNVLLSWLGIVVSVLLFGLGGSIIYLIIFNRRTRQSLHDLIAGTFVIGAGSHTGPITVRTAKLHLVIVSLILICSAALPIAIRPFISNEFFKPLLEVQERILKEPEVGSASVFEGSTKFFGLRGRGQGQSSTTSYLMVTARLSQRPADLEKEADKIASIVLSEDPRAMQKDQITISVTYGFDIGIARLWRSQVVPHSPKEWMDRLYPPR
jgi:uncharacterized RDD family membrane protein YckC